MSKYVALPFTVHAERLTAGTCENFWRLAEDAGVQYDESPHSNALTIGDEDEEYLLSPCPHGGGFYDDADANEGDWLIVFPTNWWQIARDVDFRSMFDLEGSTP